MRPPPAATCHLQCPPCCRLILVAIGCCMLPRQVNYRPLFKAFPQAEAPPCPKTFPLHDNHEPGGGRTLQLSGVGQLIETHWAFEDQAFAVRCPASLSRPAIPSMHRRTLYRVSRGGRGGPTARITKLRFTPGLGEGQGALCTLPWGARGGGSGHSSYRCGDSRHVIHLIL